MEQATISPGDICQITRRACKRVERLGCFMSHVKSFGTPYEGAYRVTLVGTINGQFLEMQALVIRECQDHYSCENCWVSRTNGS